MENGVEGGSTTDKVTVQRENFARFIVCDFCHLDKFSLCEIFPPKRYKADFERNCESLAVNLSNLIVRFCTS